MTTSVPKDKAWLDAVTDEDADEDPAGFRPEGMPVRRNPPRGVDCKVCMRDRWRVSAVPAPNGNLGVGVNPTHLAIQCCHKSCGPVDLVPVRLLASVDLNLHKFYRFSIFEEESNEIGTPNVQRLRGLCCCHHEPAFDAVLLPRVQPRSPDLAPAPEAAYGRTDHAREAVRAVIPSAPVSER